MTYDDLQERAERAELSWQDVRSGAPPEDHEWGFFSYGDAPPAIGGGVGMFTWFTDRLSMLEFIEETLPFYPPGRAGLDIEHVIEETAELVEQLRTGAITDQEGVAKLNSALKTCSQFNWIGTASDLLRGDHPYAAEVRAAFRDEGGEENNGGPITKDEQDEFFEFLDTWGV